MSNFVSDSASTFRSNKNNTKVIEKVETLVKAFLYKLTSISTSNNPFSIGSKTSIMTVF